MILILSSIILTVLVICLILFIKNEKYTDFGKSIKYGDSHRYLRKRIRRPKDFVN